MWVNASSVKHPACPLSSDPALEGVSDICWKLPLDVFGTNGSRGPEAALGGNKPTGCFVRIADAANETISHVSTIPKDYSP